MDEENFSGLELGSEPENLFILDGAYAVSQEENDKRLTLPGSPVGDFGLLFGPRVREKSLSLSFSFLATKRGRRLPALAAGLGGVRGGSVAGECQSQGGLYQFSRARARRHHRQHRPSGFFQPRLFGFL